jgi:hypothetical protein
MIDLLSIKCIGRYDCKAVRLTGLRTILAVIGKQAISMPLTLRAAFDRQVWGTGLLAVTVVRHDADAD